MDYKELIETYRSYADRWERGEQILLAGEMRLQNTMRDAADAIETLLEERDAAMEYLRAFRMYSACKNSEGNKKDRKPCIFGSICTGQYWEWRGPQKGENND